MHWHQAYIQAADSPAGQDCGQQSGHRLADAKTVKLLDPDPRILGESCGITVPRPFVMRLDLCSAVQQMNPSKYKQSQIKQIAGAGICTRDSKVLRQEERMHPYIIGCKLDNRACPLRPWSSRPCRAILVNKGSATS